jgi:hypothetical protein
MGCSSSDPVGVPGKGPGTDSGNGGSADGTEGARCYPNGTCNAGLSCLSHLCVDAGGGAGGTSGSGGTAGGGGTNVATGGVGANAGGTSSRTLRDAAAEATASGGLDGATLVDAGSGTGGSTGTAPDASLDGAASGSDAGGDGGASLSTLVIDECPGSLDAATVQSLQGATGSSGAQLLYPYDGTVFPLGLAEPTIQWSQSGTADAVYLHLKSARFEYKGCFGANALLQLPMPTTAWAAAQQRSQGATDPLTVELTIQSGGTLIGPIKQELIFALGTLKGDLFYDTYTSPQAGNNGAVMKLKLGDAKPRVLLTDTGVAPIGPCWSCHSHSANGGMLVAQHQAYPTGPYSSASFDLAANPGLNPPPKTTIQSSRAEMGLGAVYPDGTKVLTMGSPGNSSTASVNPFFPDAPGNVPAMLGVKESMLLDTATGATIPVSGWSVQYAKMPSFSPDGSKVVFNWHEDSNGHSLAVADFDTKTNTMSNVAVIYKHDTLYPGWPWITPDNREVVFVLGNAADYVSATPDRPQTAASDLWTVDIATKTARPLNRANGYTTSGAPTYLPVPGRDEHLEFFPSMSPVAAGGYFWVFFMSRRTYGNILTDQTTTLHSVDDSVTKKIWASAFDIRSGSLIADPSHPPFYVPGQEAPSGNYRPTFAPSP